MFSVTLSTVKRRGSPLDDESHRAIELSLDAFWVAGFDGYLQRVNPAFVRLLGYREDELMARPFMENVHPDDHDSVVELMALATDRDSARFECRVICADGSTRWTEWNTRAVEGVMYGVGRDVTGRRLVDDELKALRHVATLVAEGVPPEDLFAVVAEEIARVVGVPMVSVGRFDSDGSVVGCARYSSIDSAFRVGDRWLLEGASVVRFVRDTGKAARIDDYSSLESPIAEEHRRRGIRSTVGSPIVVGGNLWGAVVVSTTEPEPLPGGTELRLADFTDLLATAIENAESREALARHVDEQAAMGRLAALAMQEVAIAEICATLSNELDDLFAAGASVLRFEHDPPACAFVGISDRFDIPVGTRWEFEDGMASAEVYRTGGAARVDERDWWLASGPVASTAQRLGVVSTVARPIVVEGCLWGALTIFSNERLLPADTEARLDKFTAFVATAIASAQSREALAQLAGEQAALRRVATLVAQDVGPVDTCSAVSKEVAGLFGVEQAAVWRFDPDGMASIVGIAKELDGATIGSRFELSDPMVVATVHETGRSARVDNADWSDVDAPIGAVARRLDVTCTVASPIIVEGRVWGAIVVTSPDFLPRGSEQRLEKFTELVATAIANGEARTALAHLADEQAALRRVATLVAQAVPATEIFAAVSDEVADLFGDGPGAVVVRFDHGVPGIEFVGVSKVFDVAVGTRWEFQEGMATAHVFGTGRAARVDTQDWSTMTGSPGETFRHLGTVSTVATPILVDRRLWGAIVLSSSDELLPLDTEERLASFTELVATAIANTESRHTLAHLADEQAALRRVATLVAQGLRPAELFSAVSVEVDHLFGLELATVGRFDPDDHAFVVLGVSKPHDRVRIGSRWELNDLYATSKVYRTQRSARVEAADMAGVGGPVAEEVRQVDFLARFASPIIIEDRLWGALSVLARQRLPDDAEERLEKFSALIATAIANAENKAELAASRRRLVAASDDARRRIERDLHDGTQQRLVALGLAVRAATADIPEDQPAVRSELSRVAAGLADAVTELQELSRGIHPATLSQDGLEPALQTLARRSPIPVELDISMDERLPEPIEVGAYYVASEALANAAKHSRASFVEMSLAQQDGRVLLSIRDDGVGGADPEGGSGLVGLTDRVEALDGTMRVRSEPGDGTTITVELPLASTPEPR